MGTRARPARRSKTLGTTLLNAYGNPIERVRAMDTGLDKFGLDQRGPIPALLAESLEASRRSVGTPAPRRWWRAAPRTGTSQPLAADPVQRRVEAAREPSHVDRQDLGGRARGRRLRRVQHRERPVGGRQVERPARARATALSRPAPLARAVAARRGPASGAPRRRTSSSDASTTTKPRCCACSREIPPWCSGERAVLVDRDDRRSCPAPARPSPRRRRRVEVVHVERARAAPSSARPA